MSDLGGYVNISYSNSYYFTNACNNDMLIYPETSNQKIHIGITSNSQSIFSINSNNMNITCSALDIASTINMRSNVTILGQLTVCNVEYITSNITIYNNEIVQSNLSVFNIATLCNAVNIYGAATVSNTLNVTGLTSLCNVNISSLATLSNGLTVYNNGTTVLSNAVNIYGATTVSNNMQLTGSLSIGSNIITAGSSNRIWDFSGTIADGYGKPGYVSKSYITGSNITVSTLTPFSNLNTEGSIYLQGIAGNYITLPQPASGALPDTTIEGWIYLPVSPSNVHLGYNLPILIGNQNPTSQATYWSLGVNSSNYLTFFNLGSNYAAAPLTPIVNSNWYHIAVCYSSSPKTMQMFINGAQQTLSTWGPSTSGSNTTTATFTTGVSYNSVAPLTIGQNTNASLNAYIADLRWTNSVLYTGNFTPSTYPLQTYSNSTQLLLRAPLYNPITNINAVHTYDSMRAHCLPTDAMIYADCYGTNQPNLSGAFTPTFDSNITKSIVFTRTNSNYLSFPPQTFNIATKGFTAITKAMFTGAIGFWERIFDFGNGSDNANILFARNSTNAQLTFGMGAANGINQAFTSQSVLNQNTIFTCVARYDPFTNGGTATIWYNGSNIYSLNAMAILPIGIDRTVNNIYVGRSEWVTDSNLNANIYNFAVYNRALTDKEIIDASAALMVEPSLPNKSTVEIGNATGKPALTVQQDGTIQIAGPISTNNNLSYSPVDYGVSNFSIPGSIVGSVPAVAMTPFNTTTEGSLFVQGLSGNYISIPNNIFNTKWNNGFTCEAWVNYPTFANVSPSVYSSVPSTMGAIDSTNTDWSLGANSSSNITFAYYTTIWNNVSGTSTMQPNTWYHIAVTYDGTNIRIFQNGILQNTPIAIVGTPRNIVSNFSIAGSSANLGGGGGVANMYITNARVVYGSPLYTANFTPPTGPLGPAATGTTALLLRAPQNPGRVLIPKIGGTTQVRAYPPTAMTGYLTNIQNVSYGAGNYIVSASSQAADITLNAWKAFDTISSADTGKRWTSLPTYSTGTTPTVYNGSVSTIDINGNVYKGEWLQIQLPVAIVLNYYTLFLYVDPIYTFNILASKDGLNWQCINYQTGLSQINSLQTFQVNTNQAYNYYRLVCISGSSSTNPYIGAQEWTLYGTEESISITPDGQVGLGVSRPVQALEVAGNAIINGNISANNIGVFRNRIINGDMRINQRGTTTLTTGTANTYMVDQWKINCLITTGQITQSVITLGSSDTPYQSGIRNSLKFQATTACSSYSYIQPTHNIEATNLVDFNFGTSYSTPITCSCWLRTNLSSGSIINISLRTGAGGNGSTYNMPIMISGSNIWQYVNVTFPPPPANFTLGSSLELTIGSIYSQGSSTVGSWTTNFALGILNAVNIWATLNNFVEFTGVQLEKGTIATPFELRTLTMELQLCQRYFFQLNGSNFQVFATTFPSNNTNTADAYIPTRVTMRATPNVLTTSAMSTFNIGSATALSSLALGSDSTPDLIRLMQTGTFTNNIYASGVYLRAAASQTAYLGFSAELP